MISHLILIIALTMLSRGLPRLLRPWARGSDTFYHLLAAEYIRENRFHLPSNMNNFMISMPYDYPPLFHYFLARFSRPLRERLEPFLGGICDTVQALAIYVLVYYLSGRPEFIGLQLNPADTAWIASLVFLSCPLLYGLSYGPRAFMGTPRVLAELLTTLTLISGMLLFLTGHTLWAVAAVFLAALAVLTGAFALQVLVGFSLVLALLLKSLFFLGLPLFTVLGALVVSGGHYWTVLRGYLAFIHFYATTLIQHFAWVSERGSFKFLQDFWRNLSQRPAQVLRALYMDNQYTALLIKNPWLFLWLFLAIPNWRLIYDNNAIWYLLSWVLAGLGAFLVTSTPRFLFLGEAERYVEYAMPAIAAMIAFLLPTGNWSTVFWGIILINLGQLVVNTLFFLKRYSLAEERQTQELGDFLNREPNARHAILTIPTQYLSYRLAYETNHSFLTFPGNFGGLAYSKEIFEELFDKQFGWPNADLPLLIKKYQIDFIICQLNKLTKVDKLGINYDFSSFPISFESPGYIVYQTNINQDERE